VTITAVSIQMDALIGMPAIMMLLQIVMMVHAPIPVVSITTPAITISSLVAMTVVAVFT
jgi:hypothetical protein